MGVDLPVFSEAFLAKLKSSLDQLDVAILESVVDDPFVLLDKERARTVDDVATCFTFRVDGVYRRQKQF